MKGRLAVLGFNHGYLDYVDRYSRCPQGTFPIRPTAEPLSFYVNEAPSSLTREGQLELARLRSELLLINRENPSSVGVSCFFALVREMLDYTWYRTFLERELSKLYCPNQDFDGCGKVYIIKYTRALSLEHGQEIATVLAIQYGRLDDPDISALPGRRVWSEIQVEFAEWLRYCNELVLLHCMLSSYPFVRRFAALEYHNRVSNFEISYGEAKLPQRSDGLIY